MRGGFIFEPSFRGSMSRLTRANLIASKRCCDPQYIADIPVTDLRPPLPRIDRFSDDHLSGDQNLGVPSVSRRICIWLRNQAICSCSVSAASCAIWANRAGRLASASFSVRSRRWCSWRQRPHHLCRQSQAIARERDRDSASLPSGLAWHATLAISRAQQFWSSRHLANAAVPIASVRGMPTAFGHRWGVGLPSLRECEIDLFNDDCVWGGRIDDPCGLLLRREPKLLAARFDELQSWHARLDDQCLVPFARFAQLSVGLSSRVRSYAVRDCASPTSS